MKGDVKRKTSPPAGHPDEKLLGQPAPAPLRRDVYPAFRKFDCPLQRSARSSETEKREAVLLPTKVLSEPQGLLLFQVVRGGIEFRLGLGTWP